MHYALVAHYTLVVHYASVVHYTLVVYVSNCIGFVDQRVPAEDLLKFVRQQATWLVPSFFKDIVRKPQDLERIATALSISPNIEVFQQKLQLSAEAKKKFESALYAVRGT